MLLTLQKLACPLQARRFSGAPAFHNSSMVSCLHNYVRTGCNAGSKSTVNRWLIRYAVAWARFAIFSRYFSRPASLLAMLPLFVFFGLYDAASFAPCSVPLTSRKTVGARPGREAGAMRTLGSGLRGASTSVLATRGVSERGVARLGTRSRSGRKTGESPCRAERHGGGQLKGSKGGVGRRATHILDIDHLEQRPTTCEHDVGRFGALDAAPAVVHRLLNAEHVLHTLQQVRLQRLTLYNIAVVSVRAKEAWRRERTSFFHCSSSSFNRMIARTRSIDTPNLLLTARTTCLSVASLMRML